MTAVSKTDTGPVALPPSPPKPLTIDEALSELLCPSSDNPKSLSDRVSVYLDAVLSALSELISSIVDFFFGCDDNTIEEDGRTIEVKIEDVRGDGNCFLYSCLLFLQTPLEKQEDLRQRMKEKLSAFFTGGDPESQEMRGVLLACISDGDTGLGTLPPGRLLQEEWQTNLFTQYGTPLLEWDNARLMAAVISPDGTGKISNDALEAFKVRLRRLIQDYDNNLITSGQWNGGFE